jgi:hypothetical protein
VQAQPAGVPTSELPPRATTIEPDSSNSIGSARLPLPPSAVSTRNALRQEVLAAVQAPARFPMSLLLDVARRAHNDDIALELLVKLFTRRGWLSDPGTLTSVSVHATTFRELLLECASRKFTRCQQELFQRSFSSLAPRLVPKLWSDLVHQCDSAEANVSPAFPCQLHCGAWLCFFRGRLDRTMKLRS